ncbi:Serine/threonine protein kinase [Lentzea waywayandensis]|uniref:Serine/threonine protein kinase n=1 Tax=Lentzea waywayandensis TaxID=84724 RepID=A0A1I6EYW7_9PSEU|nr:protein kinase [Lentzea waywayandensis]SFR22899.1 Serine/threonine protein kinase [Lentzea waywayandensis]
MTTVGMRVGPAGAPDHYELCERVTEGGEGEIWLATTARVNEIDRRWAVKVLHSRHLEQNQHETPDQALARWYRKAEEAREETSQLAVPGVAGASTVFIGAEPHEPGRAGDRHTLYVVSRWIDGDDLTRWVRKAKPSFADVCVVAGKLAGIIDSISTGPLAVHHRDISPANVMVDEKGEVHLIDFTSVVPARSGPTTTVRTYGYTAPEGGNKGTAEADRYSFGAVIHFLLLGLPPRESHAAVTCRSALRRANFPAEVADHVAELLVEDAKRRPKSLRDWAARLRAMIDAVDAMPARSLVVDLDLALDVTGTPTIAAIGDSVLSRARLAVGSTGKLVPDAAAPSFPQYVRVGVDGAGEVVQFVIDSARAMWIGRSGQWRQAGEAVPAGGIAVLRRSDGSVTAFVVDPFGLLTAVTAEVGGGVHRADQHLHVQRVLASTVDADGRPATAVVMPDGELAVACEDRRDRLGVTGVAAAGLCLNTYGELQCRCVLGGGRQIAVFEQQYGEWARTSVANAPGRAADIACVGQRDGVTVAVAGDDGLWVGEDGASWQRLSDEPAHRVALGIGAAWRLRLAAVVAGRGVVASEGFDGKWPPGLRKL